MLSSRPAPCARSGVRMQQRHVRATRSCICRARAASEVAPQKVGNGGASNGGATHTNGGGGDASGPPKAHLLSHKERFEYQRDYPGLEGVAIARHVPADEAFDPNYVKHRVLASLPMEANKAVARVFTEPFMKGTDSFADLDHFTANFPPFRFIDPSGWATRILVPVNNLLSKVFDGPLKGRFAALPDIAVHDQTMWGSLWNAGNAAQQAPWASDATFAEQRLSGTNPIQIRRLSADDVRTDVLRAAVAAGTVKLSNLDRDLRDGNIFVLDCTGVPYVEGQPADFEIPADFECGTYTEADGATAQRVLPRPLAFFKWTVNNTTASDPAGGQLLPVAIKVGDKPDSRVYVPEDDGGRKESKDWLFAKLCVAIADFNCHEMQTHLGKTHLVMEPVAVATRACLPAEHPLSVLLRAHTRFMICNNDVARNRLVATGGPVDKIFAGTIASSVGLARASVLSWGFFKDSFPEHIAARGMADLPHYPYRDDGQLLWDATTQFAQDFVAAVYKDDAMVAGDADLQAWAASLADPEGGSVTGFPTAIDSQRQLAAVLTVIIFTCGPHHSAINYTQYDYGGYTLNQPTCARKGYHAIVDRPKEEPISEAELLTFLPNLEMSREQMAIAFSLSAYHYDSFGDYGTVLDSLYSEKADKIFAGLPGVLAAIADFQAALAKATKEIERRNDARTVPYPYLRPENVLNSISI